MRVVEKRRGVARRANGLVRQARRLPLKLANGVLQITDPPSLGYLLDAAIVQLLRWLDKSLVNVGGSQRVVSKISEVLVSAGAWASVGICERQRSRSLGQAVRLANQHAAETKCYHESRASKHT